MSNSADPKPKQYQVREPRSEGQSRSNRPHRQSSYRSDKDNYSNERSRDKRNNENHRDRFNAPKYRDPRYNSGNRRNQSYGSKTKPSMKKAGDSDYTENLQKLSLEQPEKAKIVEEKTMVSKELAPDSILSESQSNQSKTQPAKVKPFHGHYHHKNSNKPRFSKIFSENGTKTSVEEQIEIKEKSELETKSPGEVKAEPILVNGVSESISNDSKDDLRGTNLILSNLSYMLAQLIWASLYLPPKYRFSFQSRTKAII